MKSATDMLAQAKEIMGKVREAHDAEIAKIDEQIVALEVEKETKEKTFESLMKETFGTSISPAKANKAASPGGTRPRRPNVELQSLILATFKPGEPLTKEQLMTRLGTKVSKTEGTTISTMLSKLVAEKKLGRIGEFGKGKRGGQYILP
jgi:predicted HTH transcriptional regulator